MLAQAIQKSILDWLQLTPELLSGRSAPKLARKPRVAVATPEPQASADADPVAAEISLGTVLASPAGMVFYHPATAALDQDQNECPMQPWQQIIRQAYPDAGRTYASLESGGHQRAARAEMTGYLTHPLPPRTATTAE